MKRLISTIILIQLTFLNADNYSVSFDGVDDYATVPDNDILDIGTSDFSIQFWLKSNDNNRGIIASKSAGDSQQDPGDNTWYIIELTSGGTIQYEITDGYSGSGDYSLTTGNISVNDDEWHLISVLFDRDDAGFIYVDGELDASGTISSHSGDLSNNEPLEIGVDLNHITQYADGKLDDISFWNKVLTEGEIQASMSTSLSGSENGLVGYWNFNEGTGTTLTDQTSNGNDGTINGATWGTDVPPVDP
ncbi:MAG: LamG domain-containing protein, partial [Candidatus Marinimicrobia bacterium]|nr:LamG domain-containing protein [Candidatus Neomarinimicrobiota bacterium]